MRFNHRPLLSKLRDSIHLPFVAENLFIYFFHCHRTAQHTMNIIDEHHSSDNGDQQPDCHDGTTQECSSMTVTNTKVSPPVYGSRKQGYGMQYIIENYPTKEDSDLDLVRIQAPQRLEDFHQLRGGMDGLSIGGSSMGKLLNVSRYETSLEAYNYHVFPELHPVKIITPQQQHCFDHGNKYEKIARHLFEQLSGKKCYNGCFFKKKFPITNGSYEYFHLCPDGVILNSTGVSLMQLHMLLEPSYHSIMSLENIVQAKGNSDEIRKISSCMLPAHCVAAGCEFKVSVYNYQKSIPPDHVIQCCYGSMVLGDKPYHYVNIFIHPDTGMIEYLTYAIIRPKDELRQWLLDRFDILVPHMAERKSLPEEYHTEEMSSMCQYADIKILHYGTPQSAGLSPIPDMDYPEEALFW